MMRQIALLFLSFLLALSTLASDEAPDEPWFDRSFVLVASKKDYADAKKIASDASKKLRLKLDLRGLEPDAKTGLSFSKEKCEKEWGEHPCYFPRGRFDDGAYVSIEYSDQIKGFEKGLYVVVVANDDKNSKLIRQTLKKAKKSFPDAYAKTTKVWLGCVH